MRIRQRPEYLLAGPGRDLQSVRIVHLRPIVVEAPAVGLVEQEHRGERCDADHAGFRAREQGQVHIGQRLGARRHREPVRSRRRFAFQQGVDHDRGRVDTGLLDPEMRERRKLFAGGFGGIDGQPARRQSVQEILGDGAEVAGALEHQELVPDLGRIDPAANPEARQRQRYLAQLSRECRLHFEHGRGRHHVVRAAVFDGGDRDGGLQIVSGAQQLDAKRQLFAAPDAGVRVEANAAILLGTQFVETRGQAVALRSVGRRGPALGIRQQGVVAERVGGRLLGVRRRRRQRARGPVLRACAAAPAHGRPATRTRTPTVTWQWKPAMRTSKSARKSRRTICSIGRGGQRRPRGALRGPAADSAA